MTDPIRDELHRLNEEFDKLLGLHEGVHLPERTTPEQLVQCYGLTIDEAKVWIEQEPDFVPTDGKKQYFRTDEDETEPKCIIYKAQYVLLRI
jgi:hypothetical protein